MPCSGITIQWSIYSYLKYICVACKFQFLKKFWNQTELNLGYILIKPMQKTVRTIIPSYHQIPLEIKKTHTENIQNQIWKHTKKFLKGIIGPKYEKRKEINMSQLWIILWIIGQSLLGCAFGWGETESFNGRTDEQGSYSTKDFLHSWSSQMETIAQTRWKSRGSQPYSIPEIFDFVQSLLPMKTRWEWGKSSKHLQFFWFCCFHCILGLVWINQY